MLTEKYFLKNSTFEHHNYNWYFTYTRTYKFWTANKILPPLCIFVSQEHPFAADSVEPSLRNTGKVNKYLQIFFFGRYAKLIIIVSLNRHRSGIHANVVQSTRLQERTKML